MNSKAELRSRTLAAMSRDERIRYACELAGVHRYSVGLHDSTAGWVTLTLRAPTLTHAESASDRMLDVLEDAGFERQMVGSLVSVDRDSYWTYEINVEVGR